MDLKDFKLVTLWVLDNRPDLPCLALFTSKKSYVFSIPSEVKLNDWETQLSVYCSKIASQRFSIKFLTNALVIANYDGAVYYAFIVKNKIDFIKQINGCIYLIEKHLSGVTFGISKNGKLWILDTETNISLDSYRGPYTQTDEIDLNTYENQRWNAVSGVLGYKDGFTKFGNKFLKKF